MKVSIYNHYNQLTRTVEGSREQVAAELVRRFPWANKSTRPDVESLVKRINATQALEAYIVEDDGLAKAENRNLTGKDEQHVVQAMLGYNHNLSSVLEAAKWLAGGQGRTLEQVRQALWEADGDQEEAALLAYGLEASEANLKALRAIQNVTKTKKAEAEPAQARDVEAGHPDGSDTAEEVRRAFQDNFVMPVELGGKHSKGSLLARDHDTGRVWLLKPGSGGQTPAAGAKEDASSQSRREAAFYHLADAWGLGDFVPRADLVLVDGKEFAAIRLLPWSFKTLDKVKKDDVGAARSILDGYLREGILHRWAVLDFVLGNPDRHAQNVMVRDHDVQLIDHGSSMAGPSFDPAHDRNSFTPYYLRAWASGKFSQLDANDKLRYMPRVHSEVEESLRAWLDGLHAEDLDKVLLRYGVDSGPAKARLAKLKAMASGEPVDLAINKIWVET